MSGAITYPPRGKLLVLEGCDGSGKSTIAELLASKLAERGHSVVHVEFPCRHTTIGRTIDKYLRREIHLEPRAIHLLFSANRWEYASRIEKALHDFKTVIVVRYAYSGIAYSSGVHKLDPVWCRHSDIGLPRPDLVFYMDASPSHYFQRADYGDEVYETVEQQKIVREEFLKLQDDRWRVIKTAFKRPEACLSEILNIIFEDLETRTPNVPLGHMWEI